MTLQVDKGPLPSPEILHPLVGELYFNVVAYEDSCPDAGRIYCNLKGLNAKQGERVRLYVMSLGTEARCTSFPTINSVHGHIIQTRALLFCKQ